MQDLLCATANKQVHPELAALLFQEVRMQLATNQQGMRSLRTCAACTDLYCMVDSNWCA